MARRTHRHDLRHRGNVPEDQLGNGRVTRGHIVTATGSGEAAWESAAGNPGVIAAVKKHAADAAAHGTGLADHLADPSDAHDASAVSINDAGGYFASTEVEAALQEIGAGSVGGNVSHILLADGHPTPFTFNDLLQMDSGQDFMWSD